jgi:HD superfamily phosphohydrolase
MSASIALSRAAQHIVKHPALQGLSTIPQLGLTSHIWQGAQYDRLTHSIGVAETGKFTLLHATQNTWHERPSDRQDLWIELGGLLHDIGHGPFSHLFDRVVTKFAAKHPHWLLQHEQRSQRLIPFVLQDFPEYVNDVDIAAVQHLVHPTNPDCPRPDIVPPHLTQIISNSQHGSDVDRLDYLQRDAHLYSVIVGPLPRSLHLKPQQIVNMLKRTRFIQHQWVFAARDASVLKKLFRLRTFLFTNFYRHPRVVACELAFEDWLQKNFSPAEFNCLKMETDQDCVNFLALKKKILDFAQHADFNKYQVIKSSHTSVFLKDNPNFCPTYAWQPQSDANHEYQVWHQIPFYEPGPPATLVQMPMSTRKVWDWDRTVYYMFC